MAFDTYTEISVGADDVRQEIGVNGDRLDRAVAEVSAVVSALTAIATKYGPMVSAIGAMLAANPTNPAIAALKADIDELLNDFGALQSRAAALDALINPVTP